MSSIDGSPTYKPNKRLIARLDIKGPNVIKGIRYEGLRVVGNPAELARKYYQDGVDEILYLDTVASLYNRNNLSDHITRSASDLYVPLTVGGGIRSVHDATALFEAGADKIAINTALMGNLSLLSDLVDAFGSQSITVSIQARRHSSNKWICMTDCGRETSRHDVLEWFCKVQDHGAGEILISSVDKDGTQTEPDFQLLESINSLARIPIIASSGFSQVSHVERAFQLTHVSGVAIGASLHNGRLDVSNVKSQISSPNYTCFTHKPNDDLIPVLDGFNIGILDYGLGNLHSLQTSLRLLGAEVVVSSSKTVLDKQSCILLPGVGCFSTAMSLLNERGLTDYILEYAHSGRALVGICLGMQLLFETSNEGGRSFGLGLIPGHIRLLSDLPMIDKEAIIPHIGWSTTLSTKSSPVPLSNPLYYVHSYCAFDVPSTYVIGTANYYGSPVVSAVQKANIAGVQFHPEKSGDSGLVYLGGLILSCIS